MAKNKKSRKHPKNLARQRDLCYAAEQESCREAFELLLATSVPKVSHPIERLSRSR